MITEADIKEAARDWDHGRGVGECADEHDLPPAVVFALAIPELVRRGYPIGVLLMDLSLQCQNK